MYDMDCDKHKKPVRCVKISKDKFCCELCFKECLDEYIRSQEFAEEAKKIIEKKFDKRKCDMDLNFSVKFL